MARRIEIELTSARPDGSWTWRAAGAMKPRGVLNGNLLYEGAKAGDVVRADAEFEIEGITVVAVLTPKDKKRPEPERLEILGPPRAQEPGVTTSLASRPGRDRGDGHPRGPRRGEDADPRRGRSAPERPGTGTRERPGERSRPNGGERVGRTQRPGDGGERSGRGQRPGEGDRTARSDRVSAGRVRRAQTASTSEGLPDGQPSGRSPTTPARPKPRRLNPAHTHRSAVLDALVPEHRPIAEQVLRGGIPAVRGAIHLEREKAAAEGRPAPNSEALLAIAEELLPRLKGAEWRDRAEAAVKVADDLTLRDLRSVVAGADVARDDESRQLAATLREALARRIEALRSEWLEGVAASLRDGRLIRGLRLSARPPDPGARLPAELAGQLTDQAGQAMASDTALERWAALLDAVAASAVRRTVKPAGLPTDADEPLLQAARQQSGRVPALAAMLGLSMPPPPRPLRPPAGGAKPPGDGPTLRGRRRPDRPGELPGVNHGEPPELAIPRRASASPALPTDPAQETPPSPQERHPPAATPGQPEATGQPEVTEG